jgi:hypothetical protein
LLLIYVLLILVTQYTTDHLIYVRSNLKNAVFKFARVYH